MFGALASPAAFAVVGQSINYLTTVGEKTRMERLSQVLKEEQIRNQIQTVGEQSAFDKENFDKNSIPIGFCGAEIGLDGDELQYFSGDQYTSVNLSQRTFKPLHYEEALNDSKMIAVLLTIITEVSKSIFLSDEKKHSLEKAISHYMEASLQHDGSINFITGIVRKASNDYTYEELEQIYQDYKANKDQKTYKEYQDYKKAKNEGFKQWFRYFFGSRHKDKYRFLNIAESLDTLKEELASSIAEIRGNLKHIKDECIKKLGLVNVFKDKRKSELLTRVTKSKVLLQRLYMAYKNNGNDLDDALFKVACELYRQHELVQDKSYLSNEQNKNIRKIEKKHIAYTSDNEVKEQVKRYFNFNPNVTRFIKTDKHDITIDKYSKMIEIQDKFNGVYYLDFNQLNNDVGNEGGILYYQLLLEALESQADDYAYTISNPKYEKVMRYIEDVVTKMKTKSLTKDEYEYLPNMLFHWISSLTNKPLLTTDTGKKIVTVTFMDGNDRSKTSDEIDNFHNVSFDVYDQKTGQMKMGTIMRRGEKIYYKEDPGQEDFKVVSAEALLTKLDVKLWQGKDFENKYIGDTWAMRKMISFVQKIRDKELKEKKGTGKETEQVTAYTTEDKSKFLPTEADVANDELFNDKNDNNDFQFRDIEKQKGSISHEIPLINLQSKDSQLNI